MEVSRERLNVAATAVYERTVRALGVKCGPTGCAELSRQLNAAIDSATAAAALAGAAIACVPGCTYCCHLRVEVFEHEAAALQAALRSLDPATAAEIERRILVNAARIDGMSAAEHRSAGVACAFLIDGRCSVHPVRPSACAAYHSLSRERCEDSFRHPSGIGTPRNARPASLELHVFGTALIEATHAACKDAGRTVGQAELHQSMRALLENDRSGDDAEKRGIAL